MLGEFKSSAKFHHNQHTNGDLPKRPYQNSVRHWSSILWESNQIRSWKNSLLISKVENRKLAGAPESCLVMFGTLQWCAPTESCGNRTCDLTVGNQVTTNARSRVEVSTSPINDIARIIPWESNRIRSRKNYRILVTTIKWTPNSRSNGK